MYDPPTNGGFLVKQGFIVLPHVGRQVFDHFSQLRGDNHSPRLGQGSAVVASDVEKSNLGCREDVEISLRLPRDVYQTIGHGGTKRFDVDLGQRGEYVDVTGGVDYPSEHVGPFGGG